MQAGKFSIPRLVCLHLAVAADGVWLAKVEGYIDLEIGAVTVGALSINARQRPARRIKHVRVPVGLPQQDNVFLTEIECPVS